jgi:hypothetical protein
LIAAPYCDGCGAVVSSEQSFCDKCGRHLNSHRGPTTGSSPESFTTEFSSSRHQDATFSSGQTVQPSRRTAQSRPTGVKLLAAVLVIGGILDIVMAVLFLALSHFSFHILGVIVAIPQFSFLLLLLLLAALAVSSIFSFVLAYGVLEGKGWAWTWTLVSCVLNLISSVACVVVGIGIGGFILYPIIIYYLTRPHVRRYFGRG